MKPNTANPSTTVNYCCVAAMPGSHSFASASLEGAVHPCGSQAWLPRGTARDRAAGAHPNLQVFTPAPGAPVTSCIPARIFLEAMLRATFCAETSSYCPVPSGTY